MTEPTSYYRTVVAVREIDGQAWKLAHIAPESGPEQALATLRHEESDKEYVLIADKRDGQGENFFLMELGEKTRHELHEFSTDFQAVAQDYFREHDAVLKLTHEMEKLDQVVGQWCLQEPDLLPDFEDIDYEAAGLAAQEFERQAANAQIATGLQDAYPLMERAMDYKGKQDAVARGDRPYQHAQSWAGELEESAIRRLAKQRAESTMPEEGRGR